MDRYRPESVVERRTERIQAAATPRDRFTAATEGVRALAIVFDRLRDDEDADAMLTAAADALAGIFEEYAAPFRTPAGLEFRGLVIPSEPATSEPAPAAEGEGTR